MRKGSKHTAEARAKITASVSMWTRARAGRLGGLARARRLTPARRQAIGRMGGAIGGPSNARIVRRRREAAMAELRATAEALAAEIAKGEQATLAYNQLRLRLNPVLPALPDDRSWTYKLIAD